MFTHNGFIVDVLYTEVIPIQYISDVKVLVRMFWLTKFYLNWPNFKFFALYFTIWTDKIFKITSND